MGELISCKEYVQIKKEELKNKISALHKKPTLCVVQIGLDQASQSYVKGKKKDCEEVGITFLHHHIENYEDVTEEDLIDVVKGLNATKEIDGIIIQLPIPEKYNVETLQKYISPWKDVDGFRIDSEFDPCTPKGIIDWLSHNDYQFSGKDVVVVGRSKIVGKPLVNMLIDKGATVTCCNSKTDYLPHYTRYADLVVSAIGKPKYFNDFDFECAEIVIDVGINRDENGKLCGDVDREDVDERIYVTPVPGGVGLLTRLALIENVVTAATCFNLRRVVNGI